MKAGSQDVGTALPFRRARRPAAWVGHVVIAIILLFVPYAGSAQEEIFILRDSVELAGARLGHGPRLLVLHGGPSMGYRYSGMVAALANMRRHREKAVELLLRLVHDEALATQAMITLGAMREARATGVIEPFLEHDDPWVRGQAKRALAKIRTARDEEDTVR